MTVGESYTFAQMLRRHRRAAGLSQAALAERAQLSRDGVSALERGVSRAPRQDTVQLLLDALQLSPAEHAQLLAAAQSSRPFAADSHESAHDAGQDSLPRPLTSIVGREIEITALSELLRREDVRLVTLTGAPGIGKTRLAIHVARTLAGAFPSGVVFLPLAPIREPSLVVPAIARALRLREASGRLSSERRASEPEWCSLLLVLDSFERLVAAAPALVDLIEASPHVKALVTSRSPLRVRGEHEFPVSPLWLPGDAAEAGRYDVDNSPAVELFARRAAAVQPEFALTPQEAPVVAEICRRVDGLPLAIELAAARIKLLPPAALLARLTPALPLLTRGVQDLPERQHTMRRAIAWSYDLLDSRLQRYFRACAIFAGGWTLEAAEQVCGSAQDLAASVLDALATLVDQSLVARVARESGESRFRLLATVREFGLEQLRECGELDEMARRHACYYMEVAEAGEVDASFTGNGLPQIRLEDERNNLNSALRWALQHGEVEIAARLASALSSYWWMSGYLVEGRAWLTEVGDALSRASESLRTPATAHLRAKVMRGAALLTGQRFAVEEVGSLAGESREFAYTNATGEAWDLA